MRKVVAHALTQSRLNIATCALVAVGAVAPTAAATATAHESSLRGGWLLGPPKVQAGRGADTVSAAGKATLRRNQVCINATIAGLEADAPARATLYRSRRGAAPVVIAVHGDPHVDQKDGTRWDFKSCETVSPSAARRLIRKPTAHFVQFETTNHPNGLFRSKLRAPRTG